MTDSPIKEPTDLNGEQVEEFLLKNPDFFVERDDLVAQIKLSHRPGSAISLVERQLKILRDRDAEFQTRFEHLVRSAKDNDRRFESIRKITLSLLESRDTDQALEAVKDSLDHDFSIEFHKLILFSRQAKELPIRTESKDVAESVLGMTLSDSSIYCGGLESKQKQFLFGEGSAECIKSIAIAPLNFPERIGILALGSRDETQFKADTGTLFIGFLGDVLSRHLAHLMQLQKSTSIKK